jgi:hypothetical protein
MRYFSDVAALRRFLEAVYKGAPGAAGQAQLVDLLERWDYSKEQATVCASVVLSQNNEGSAGRVAQNAAELVGSWVRGTMQGGGTAWLRTTQETWEFREDLTYSRKQQSYEGGSTGVWPNFQASYSKPSSSTEWGVWAPGDWRDASGKLFLVTISEHGRARRLEHNWTDNAPYYHSGCAIDGESFGRQV